MLLIIVSYACRCHREGFKQSPNHGEQAFAGRRRGFCEYILKGAHQAIEVASYASCQRRGEVSTFGVLKMSLRGVAKATLLLPLLQPGSSFTGRIPTASAARASMSTAASIQQGYWAKAHSGVPASLLKQIREEPWRGALEPCIDHPLTEITVEGEVPKALQGTLFRNGKSCVRRRGGVARGRTLHYMFSVLCITWCAACYRTYQAVSSYAYVILNLYVPVAFSIERARIVPEGSRGVRRNQELAADPDPAVLPTSCCRIGKILRSALTFLFSFVI